MEYQEALDYILGLSDYERSIGGSWPATRFSLERVARLCELLGRPQDVYPCVQIAGTKGKGSTAAMIAAALGAAELRVGLFTSPHLHCFRERVRLGEEMIPEGELARLVDEIKPRAEELQALAPELGTLTTFEVLTALALLYFARAHVDVAVLEVGLGGRLDATSVVRPAVAAITSISLDHTHILGDTLGQIAREKAGIIKPGAFVVSSPQATEAAQVLDEVAAAQSAELLLGEREWRWWQEGGRGGAQRLVVTGGLGTFRGPLPALLGRHQLGNAATAVVVLQALRVWGLRLPDEAIATGLATVRWPARFEVAGRRPWVVIDGAHNDDSAWRLREALAEQFPDQRLFLVLGTSADKDLAGIVAALAPAASEVLCTRSRHPRSASVESLLALCQAQGVVARPAADVATALRQALTLAGPEDVVCAAGSLFVAAEAREALGLGQPC
ncbi:MAG: bifunctional folylpolyglutamate synthase/dihydrofolate synthase [Chloroflexota bacterium]